MRDYDIWQKYPFINLDQVRKLDEKYSTPFYIYNEAGIKKNAQDVKAAFEWNVGYKEFFSIKACPNPEILRILLGQGCGLECSSLSELYLAKALGTKGEDIMFSSNNTPDEEYEYAYKIGATINLDDITHIDQLEDALWEMPKRISCRFNPGGLFVGSPGFSPSWLEREKFGMTEEQIFEAFERLMELGVEEFGLHASLDNNTLYNEYYAKVAEMLFKLAVRLRDTFDCKISFINLSGGVGLNYHVSNNLRHDIFIASEKVQNVYDKILVPNGMRDVAIYTEMGRFMTGPYGHLVAKVIHEKKTYRHYYGIDADTCALTRSAMHGAEPEHHVTIFGKEDAEKFEKVDIVGSLRGNGDKFAEEKLLPRIEIGDYVCIHDAGAHCRAMGNNYNGKLLPQEILLRENGSFECIREAERMSDYFATLRHDPAIKMMQENPDQFPKMRSRNRKKS